MILWQEYYAISSLRVFALLAVCLWESYDESEADIPVVVAFRLIIALQLIVTFRFRKEHPIAVKILLQLLPLQAFQLQCLVSIQRYLLQ